MPARCSRRFATDTLLVSLMHVNNETGVIQPIAEIADGLHGREPYLHVDAAQSFAREIAALRHPRIDLISVSAHKIGGPKGVGALVVRRRDGRRPPLQPLMFGGGQERQLRPGTLPVPLIAGLGLAAELAVTEAETRDARCRAFRESLLAGLAPLDPVVNGDLEPDGALHPEPLVPGHGRGDRHRRVGRSRGHLERRRVHVAELHVQSRARRDAAAGMEKGRRAEVLVVRGLDGAGLERPRRRRRALSGRRKDRGHVSAARDEHVYYRRSRFTTHLPVDRRYSPAHYWLFEESPGLWRVGLTKFATRMLGDIVEFEFGAPSGAEIGVGDEIGTIEGLKAVTSVFSAGSGRFARRRRSPEAGCHARRIRSLRTGLVV